MKKYEITEETIQTYMEYLISVRLCYGFDTYKRKFNAALKAAKETYSIAAVRKLRVELAKRIDDEYNKRVRL